MDGSVYFDGDPATDSARRHMERVLKGQPAGPRWAWMLAAVAGGGLWLMWRTGARGAADARRQEAGAGVRGNTASREP